MNRKFKKNIRTGKMPVTMLIIFLALLCAFMVYLVIKNEETSIAMDTEAEDVSKQAEEYDYDVRSISRGGLGDEVLEEEEEDKYNLSKEEKESISEAVHNDKSGLFKLVNKDNPLSQDYIPQDLTVPGVRLQSDPGNEQMQLRKPAVKSLEELFADAQKNGLDLYLNSGFRGYQLQTYLYNRDLQQNGGKSSNYVAKEGVSEHQLGLAVDITCKNVGFQLIEDFQNTAEGKWLMNNAYKYGFILRYGRDKEQVTGYKYEPWHYRYIGNREISRICHEKNLTLEEILEEVK